MNYQPFRYPPDYQLAFLHQQCSRPGRKPKEPIKVCPCCQEKAKQPFTKWWTRSISNDFKDYGGSVVTYFWLLKFYAGVSGGIILMYSIYLFICIQDYCQGHQECTTLFGLSVVSNEDLHQIINLKNDRDVLIRLYTLRGITFLVLLIANAISLYIAARFKYRHPAKPTISNYSILFKNINIQVQDLVLKLKQQFPQIQIKQAFLIKRLQPYFSLSKQKLETYYQCLIQKKSNRRRLLLKKLYQLDRVCSKEYKDYNQTGDRVIVIFNSIEMKDSVIAKYQGSTIQKLKMFFNISEKRVYCQPCPAPEEIIWNNLGQVEYQKLKMKILSLVYFLLLIGCSYLILAWLMHIVYSHVLSPPWQSIIVNIILVFVVAIALTFRQLMNRLSQMRHPNTQTNRTLFIVTTTVLFHFIYYIIIPTIYFYNADNLQKSETLALISNQTINFGIVQFILASIDLMYCIWNRKRKSVQDSSRPIGCQKILHEKISYPRFPIQFKLIILFKYWSFAIFFAFQVPIVFIFMFMSLVFLFFKDKHSVYNYYKMQIIDNSVQFNFLKIYANFFSVYMLIIFLLTQHLQVQFWISVATTVVVVVFQTFLIKNKGYNDQTLPSSLEELELKTPSYKKIYMNFVDNIQNDSINQDIKVYLGKYGFGSLRTQELTENLIQNQH